MLIDYDAANNIGGRNGSLRQERTLSRIFGFLIQLSSQKFDNDGQFIKKYVPELKQVPQKYIHQPNLMNEALQTQYHVHLGENYPNPLSIMHQVKTNIVSI